MFKIILKQYDFFPFNSKKGSLHKIYLWKYSLSMDQKRVSIIKYTKNAISHILKKSYAKFFIIVVHSLFSLASETFSAKSWTWGILILHFYLHSSTSDLPNPISGGKFLDQWHNSPLATLLLMSAICCLFLKSHKRYIKLYTVKSKPTNSVGPIFEL